MLLGVSLVIAVELLGIRSLTFAVGAYLPIGTTLPIFVGRRGALVRGPGGRACRGDEEAESDISSGSSFASGLIAAGGIAGLIGVALKARRSHLLRQSRPAQYPAHVFRSLVGFGDRVWCCWRFRCFTSRGSR